jgi:hypothetical protein
VAQVSSDTAWLLAQLADVQSAANDVGFRIGTVISYAGGTMTVQIGAPIDVTDLLALGLSTQQSGQVVNAAYLSKHGGYLPVAGDLVLVARIGAAWVVLGTFGNITGNDPYFDIIPPGITDGRMGHFTTFNSGGTPTVEVSVINSDRAVDGGRLWLTASMALLAWATAGVASPPTVRLDTSGIYLDGSQWKFTPLPTTAQAVSGRVDTPSGFGAQGYSYGATMSGTMYPYFQVFNATASFSWYVSAVSQTAATVAWSDTTAKTTWLIFLRTS